jgi:hypothetical protein
MRFSLLLGFTLLSAVLFSSSALAEVIDVNVYARGALQVGKDGVNGARIDQPGGFAPTTRLLERQYFEFSTTTKLKTDARFNLTLASDGDSFHYTNNWASTIAIRDLFFELGKLPEDANYSVWFGSRMYRGDDIYLFDMWPLDNQNFLGAGVSHNIGKQTIEFALGAKQDSPYAKGTATTYTTNAQRFVLINRYTQQLSEGRKVKTNAELHFIPKSTATMTVGTTNYNLDTPSTYGAMLGGEYSYTPGHNVFLNYAYGQASGAMDTPSYLVSAVGTSAGTVTGPGLLTSKKGSHVLQFALGGSQEVAKLSGGFLYGAVVRYVKPGDDTTTGLSTTGAVRPMYYLNDRLHLGAEADLVLYPKNPDVTQNINYLQLAPMIEYALNNNAYGSPKLRFIASNCFYGREITTKYGDTSRYAFNVAAGFELWF